MTGTFVRMTPSHHEHLFPVKRRTERMFDFLAGSGYPEIT